MTAETLAETENSQASSSLSSNRQSIATLMGILERGGFVNRSTLQERLEPDLLAQAGLISSSSLFSKKLIRLNTSMLYRQQRFNLLREESEGYSKLIVLLSQLRQEAEMQFMDLDIFVENLYQKILSLIGFFDLDPTRVLDLILDQFIMTVTNGGGNFFLRLFQKFDFPSSTIASLALFKLEYLGGELASQTTSSSTSNIRGNEEVFENLMIVLGMLVKHSLINLAQIFPSLEPRKAESLHAELDKWTVGIKGAIKAASTVSLGSVEKPSQKESKDPKDFMMKEYPTDPTIEYLLKPALSNQCGYFVAALLRVGHFKDGIRLLLKMPALLRLHPPVGMALANVINISIDWILEPKINLRTDGFFNLESRELSQLVEEQVFCKSRDKFTIIMELVQLLGSNLWQDGRLAHKICRLGMLNHFGNKKEWTHILTQNLFPALSIASPNPALAIACWDLMQHRKFSLFERWAIYGHIKDTENISLEVALGRAHALKSIRKVMRRLARENVKQFGRSIGKLAHQHPTVVFSVMLDQLQAYDNLVPVVVDACKYLGPLGFDILIYVLIDCFAAEGVRDRLKEDGTNLAGWLQSLATFTGTLARKYSTIDLYGILLYVTSQMWDENGLDLCILSELIERMGGIEPLANLNDAQLEGATGGPILRGQLSLNNVYAGHSVRPNKRASMRLLTALLQSPTSIEDNTECLPPLLWPLCILLAQQRKVSILSDNFDSSGGSSHLKLLSTLADQCHETFLHYCDFLALHAEEARLKSAIEQFRPSFDDLIKLYGIEKPSASHIVRLLERITCPEIPFFDRPLISSTPDEKYSVPRGLENLFWRLDLGDICVPLASYQAELLRLNNLLNSSNVPPVASADSAIAVDALAKWKRDRERAPQLILALETERKLREAHSASISEWIVEHSSDWIIHTDANDLFLSTFILQCIIPRSLFSPTDALFAARFPWILHRTRMIQFSTWSYLNRIFEEISTELIFGLTEMEAHQLGRFLNDVLETLHVWHSDSAAYIREALGENDPNGPFVGFKRIEQAQISMQIDQKEDLETGEIMEPSQGVISSHYTHKEFRDVLYSWHLQMFRTFCSLLGSTEYMRIRNAIIILTRINGHFPRINRHGDRMAKIIGSVREEESREDLKVLAIRYSAMLSVGKAKWVDESQFHDTLVEENDDNEDTSIIEKDENDAMVNSNDNIVDLIAVEMAETLSIPPSTSTLPSSSPLPSHDNAPSEQQKQVELEMRKALEERRAAVIASQASKSSVVDSASLIDRRKEGSVSMESEKISSSEKRSSSGSPVPAKKVILLPTAESKKTVVSSSSLVQRRGEFRRERVERDRESERERVDREMQLQQQQQQHQRQREREQQLQRERELEEREREQQQRAARESSRRRPLNANSSNPPPGEYYDDRRRYHHYSAYPPNNGHYHH